MPQTKLKNSNQHKIDRGNTQRPQKTIRSGEARKENSISISKFRKSECKANSKISQMNFCLLNFPIFFFVCLGRRQIALPKINIHTRAEMEEILPYKVADWKRKLCARK